jgi:hypothetical protein
MSGYFIHFDVARKAIEGLETNPNTQGLFQNPGGAAAIKRIAQAYPSYFALGAIGPDIFFLLPDFKGTLGKGISTIADTIRAIYPVIDETILIPWEDIMGTISDNSANLSDVLTGGLSSQLATVANLMSSIHMDALIFLASRQYDIFSLLGSGIPAGYDEQTFYWSDTLHTRQTSHVAARLWHDAAAISDTKQRERFQAFALGWMTHVATDITGHCYVNQKTGGPYRLHWQRHHLVENHMDSKVYDSEYGSHLCYEMLTKAGLHRWIAFSDQALSLFDHGMGPDYPKGAKPAEVTARDEVFDVDSKMPGDLADFICRTLKNVYSPAISDPNYPEGQEAGSPTILSDTYNREGFTQASLIEGGFPTKDDIAGIYFWYYKYLRMVTMDGHKFTRPEPPTTVVDNPFPDVPGNPEIDGDNIPADIFSLLLAALAWLLYLGQVVEWGVGEIVGQFASNATIGLREKIYQYVILPLYNMWLTLHWYLSIAGFSSPNQDEIQTGLEALGKGFEWDWEGVEAALNDPLGGLGPQSLAVSNPPEPSKNPHCNESYPRDVVQDPGIAIAQAGSVFGFAVNSPDEAPSEFLNPWLWPQQDLEGHNVRTETQRTMASPYRMPQDSNILVSGLPGDNIYRKKYESAGNETETRNIQSDIETKHLGAPVDYAAYVLAQLTAPIADYKQVPNFSLDSDRGYGYLCWDWKRTPATICAPKDYRTKVNPNPANGLGDGPYKRAYRMPVQPGTGWKKDDYLSGNPASAPDPKNAVKIRYIDKEVK